MQHRVFDGLNARSVYRIVTGLVRAAGIDGFHPHSLLYMIQIIVSDANKLYY